jgi:hypothetical protein
MAFSSLPASLIAVGKATVKQIFQILKDNQDDLNTRLSSVEATGNKRVFFNGVVRGASSFTSGTNAAQIRIESAIDVTDVIVSIYDDTTAITSGVLEIDIIKATGPGDGPDFSTSVSIFTTRPSIDFSTASDYDESSNQVLNITNASLLEGDYIQLNISGKPLKLGRFFFYAIGEGA